MKKHLKFIFLAPLLFAAICDPAEDSCSVEDLEPYTLIVENVAETYGTNDTIWLDGQISSMLVNFCTNTNEPELITDVLVFQDGVFILKLNNQPELNAEVFTNVAISFDIGEPFNFNTCSEAITYLPELSENSLSYEYRFGISINVPGDYCIVSAMNNEFNLESQNNSQIFNSYNTLDNQIKFQSCDITFTRVGTDGHYFFTIE